MPTDPRGALGLISSYTFERKRPYGLTWNLGAQRVLHKDYTFEARYVGHQGRSPVEPIAAEHRSPVTATNSIPTFFSMPSASTLSALTTTLAKVKGTIVPGGTASIPYNFLASQGSVAPIVAYAPQGYSNYNGLALQLTRRFANNFQYVVAYTWSHLLDDSTATNFSTYLSPAPRPGLPKPARRLGFFGSGPPAAFHLHAHLRLEGLQGERKLAAEERGQQLDLLRNVDL